MNASPSLSSDTAADFHLKFAMVDAALSLADVDGQFGGNLPASYNGFDLICDNGSFMQARSTLPCLPVLVATACMPSRSYCEPSGLSAAKPERVACGVQVHPGMPSMLGCDLGLPKRRYPEKLNARDLRANPELARAL